MKYLRLGWVVFLLASSPLPAAEDLNWHAAGKGGAVAAEDPKAVAAGIEMLEKGGNAVDAAVATMIVASIMDYGMFCIGAEVPFMIYDAQKRQVKTMSGLGRAPLSRDDIKWYYENAIPAGGGIKAVPVPGAVGLFFDSLAVYGTMDFATVAAPALRILDERGQDWHDELAGTFRRLIDAERAQAGTRVEKLQSARARFYSGDIAEELVAYYRNAGGFLTREDLAAHKTLIEDPVMVEYRGFEVYKCGTWTQGPYLCQTLQILEGFDLRKMEHLSADYIHVLAEALKLGLADRDYFYGDPEFVDVPMEPLLSQGYGDLRRTLIDPESASMEVRPGDPLRMKALNDNPGRYRPGPGGTTTCVVADKWGNFVSATPSGNAPYNICESLGIAHGNRLRSLNTTPGHPNRIEAGKRPRITLTPTLVLKDGAPVIAISVAGGDLQDQTTLNCLLNFIEFGMLPREAVSSARFSTRHHENSFNPAREREIAGLGRLTLQNTIPETVKANLVERGHQVATTGGAIASPVMLYHDRETGMLHVAGDPRAGRHAAVLEPAK